MSSSTVPDATPRLLLDRGPHAGPPEGGPIAARALSAGLCSPAGLHTRPWLARLREALREELFVLHFQPIVRVRDRTVAHHEALLRLADEPRGRLVAPAHFLPAAERYGLIRDIDRMVVDRVAAQLAGQPAARGGIAVNLSALSVTDAGMLEHIARRLDHHAVDASRLVVELTETAAISDMDSARRFCAGALALGCEVALDDFGAGFGSFQYLKHLPFSYLKIDGDFVRRLPSSRTDQLLVQALAGVARGMGAQTIAEFVGDEATIELLRGYGVDYAQGYAVGRPRATLAAAAER
jgi:EAL domain-containing protein (putative c-di-GMP-specific phosphodiesterase class I)